MGIIFRNFALQNFRSLALPCSQKGLIHPAIIPRLKPKGKQNHFSSKSKSKTENYLKKLRVL
jgi:hypothetical protein